MKTINDKSFINNNDSYYHHQKTVNPETVNIDINENDINVVIQKINTILMKENSVTNDDINDLQNTLTGELKTKYNQQSNIKSSRIQDIESLLMEYSKKS